ncbi:restriction endonuclease subunit S [Priestia flexa]|uniref:restriction endonuclease subunit S n=1 Tax=Priestia flexa TaxID=86664 RepID=UPI00099D54C2|nr:restriction endonuclease subunit S [Priestia flexa]AQX53078.1 hypothetical protein BC359_01405 [Priestia flexa]
MDSNYVKTEVGILPSDWEVEFLDNAAERKSGHTPDKKIEEYWNGNIPWISLKDLSKLNRGYVYETTDYTTIEGIKNSSAVLLPPGTIVISRDATVGKIGILSEEMATSQHFINYICGNRLDNVYLYYHLLFRNHVFERIATGSTIKTIGLGFFKKLKVALPPIKEQQKIASILSTWDMEIDLKEKLIEQKKLQKKGLMQKLLTGEVRLPGFDKEWKKKRIGDLIEESKIIANSPELDKRITVRLNLKGVCKRESTSVEKEGATTQYIRKEGQFIYGKQNLHKGAFGLIPKELNGFQSSSDIPSFNFKEGVDSLWFYYYFSRENFYTNLENISSGTGSKRIQPKELYKLTLKLPSFNEQQRQSQILACIDKEIYLLEKKLETYKKQKQGLMQLLLTGKVRVTV